MKFKIKIDKFKDKIAKERYTTSFKLKILIIVCWIAYITCLIIKLCGANLFEIACENERFILICDYIDNTLWLKMIIACIFSLITNSFVICAIFREKFYTLKQVIVFVPLIVIGSIISWYFPLINTIIGFLLYLIPIAYNYHKWYRAIIGLILMISFQFISLATKNVNSIYLNNQNTLVSIILQIDLLIMVILYYLYANARKEVKN